MSIDNLNFSQTHHMTGIHLLGGEDVNIGRIHYQSYTQNTIYKESNNIESIIHYMSHKMRNKPQNTQK